PTKTKGKGSGEDRRNENKIGSKIEGGEEKAARKRTEERGKRGKKMDAKKDDPSIAIKFQCETFVGVKNMRKGGGKRGEEKKEKMNI
ncbi:hypothetical protein HYI23_17905, partial [Clostridium botulinum]|uniref:hypothetical protein n=1 Tax=Clostridium botulinum TaxID=1491 RepID=UPI001C9B375E